MKNDYLQDKLNLLNKGGENINADYKKQLLKKVVFVSQNKSMKLGKNLIIPPLALGTLVALFMVFTGGFYSYMPMMSGLSSVPRNSVMEDYDEVMPMMDDYGISRSEVSVNEPSGGADISAYNSKVAPIMPYYPYRDKVSDSSTRYYNSDASVTLEAENISDVIEKVKSVVSANEGMLSNISYTQEGKSSDYAYLTFNVPIDNVNNVVTQIKGLGYSIVRESMNIQDVTGNVEGYDDQTQTNIEEAQSKIEELQQLLNTNITAQQRINYQSQIDSNQRNIDMWKKEMQEYKDRYKYGTVMVGVEKPKGFLDGMFQGNRFVGEYYQSGGVAFRFLGLFLRFLGHLLVWAGVFSVVWIPIVLLRRWMKRGKKDDKEKVNK